MTMAVDAGHWCWSLVLVFLTFPVEPIPSLRGTPPFPASRYAIPISLIHTNILYFFENRPCDLYFLKSHRKSPRNKKKDPPVPAIIFFGYNQFGSHTPAGGRYKISCLTYMLINLWKKTFT